MALLSQRVVPIINENDTVATEEIRFGDNDNLSAMVANLIDADLLILLTDQKGLYTEDPRKKPDAVLVDEVNTHDIPDNIWSAAGYTKSELGTGGMVTKLQAADLARRSGTSVVIASGNEPNIAERIIEGEKVGTLLKAVSSNIESRKRYLLTSLNASGSLKIDEGAETAINKGGSLLPIGLLSVRGEFDRGDVVRIENGSKKEIAVGTINYSSKEMSKISGMHSEEIEKILGYTYGDEVIHHNNMIIL